MGERVLWAAEELRFAIGRQTLFDGASFAINEGERVALVGRNGCGKSTLLRIITGAELPSSGTVSAARELRTALLPQEFDGAPEQSALDYLRGGLRWYEELLRRYETLPAGTPGHEEAEHQLRRHDAWDPERKLRQLLETLALPDPGRPCGVLSGGEKRRLALGRAVLAEPELLLLDEPTNHLDVSTIEWVETLMAGWRGGCLFVTHDRFFLDRLATRIVELDGGRFYSYRGSYADFLVEKAAREQREDLLEAKRRSFLRSEIEWVRRSPKARLRRNLGRLRQFQAVAAQSGPERVGEMELLIPPPGRLGNQVVTLTGVSLGFGGRTLIRDLDFEFQPNFHLGVVGPNGVGKTSLVRLITGELQPDHGSVKIAPTVAFNCIDQSRLVLNPEHTVIEELDEGGESVQLGAERISIRAYLKRFLFEDERINTRIKYLSGGERARLALAKVLKRGGNFLILDEPTNDLDLTSLRLLEEALAAFPGCVLVVSHDRYFLNRVCDGILAFEGDGRLFYEPGDYDYYRQQRERREARVAPEAPEARPVAKAAPAAAAAPEAPRKLSFRERRELEGMEEAILNSEAREAELEAIFSAPDFFSRYGSRRAELQAELEAARERTAALYRRWAELEARNH